MLESSEFCYVTWRINESFVSVIGQARSLPTDKLRIFYISINGAIYVIQVSRDSLAYIGVVNTVEFLSSFCVCLCCWSIFFLRMICIFVLQSYFVYLLNVDLSFWPIQMWCLYGYQLTKTWTLFHLSSVLHLGVPWVWWEHCCAIHWKNIHCRLNSFQFFLNSVEVTFSQKVETSVLLACWLMWLLILVVSSDLCSDIIHSCIRIFDIWRKVNWKFSCWLLIILSNINSSK